MTAVLETHILVLSNSFSLAVFQGRGVDGGRRKKKKRKRTKKEKDHMIHTRLRSLFCFTDLEI